MAGSSCVECSKVTHLAAVGAEALLQVQQRPDQGQTPGVQLDPCSTGVHALGHVLLVISMSYLEICNAPSGDMLCAIVATPN